MPCDGSCCVAFPIGNGRDRLGDPKATDGDLLHFMLRRITAQEAAERRARFGAPGPVVERDGDDWFMCVYWNEETRLCSIYEHRPHMCSGYPGYPGADRDLDRESTCDHGCDCKGSEYCPPARPPAGLSRFS